MMSEASRDELLKERDAMREIDVCGATWDCEEKKCPCALLVEEGAI